jgi:hypothetical protein
MGTTEQQPCTRPFVADGNAAAYQPLQWTTLKAEAARVGVGVRRLYRAASEPDENGRVPSGRLKAVRVNSRGDWRTLPTWVDDWLLSSPGREAA